MQRTASQLADCRKRSRLGLGGGGEEGRELGGEAGTLAWLGEAAGSWQAMGPSSGTRVAEPRLARTSLGRGGCTGRWAMGPPSRWTQISELRVGYHILW